MTFKGKIMDNKSIWDLISKIAMPKILNGGNTHPSPSSADSAQQNSSDNGDAPSFEQDSNFQPSEENFSTDNGNEKNMSGSFLKSYNPFASPLIEKPQITSQRAEKPLRNTIDLRGSKNLTNGEKKEKTRNIIDLINRHNYYSNKIKNGK